MIIFLLFRRYYQQDHLKTSQRLLNPFRLFGGWIWKRFDELYDVLKVKIEDLHRSTSSNRPNIGPRLRVASQILFMEVKTDLSINNALFRCSSPVVFPP